MKKRLIISLSVLVIIITLSIISYYVTKSETETISYLMSDIYNRISQNQIPTKEYPNLKKEWDKSKKIFNIFLVHGHINELDTNIESMEKYMKAETLDELEELCIRSIYLIDDLHHINKISIDNIL